MHSEWTCAFAWSRLPNSQAGRAIDLSISFECLQIISLCIGPLCSSPYWCPLAYNSHSFKNTSFDVQLDALNERRKDNLVIQIMGLHSVRMWLLSAPLLRVSNWAGSLFDAIAGRVGSPLVECHWVVWNCDQIDRTRSTRTLAVWSSYEFRTKVLA